MAKKIDPAALETAKTGARLIRNERLSETDKFVLPDSPLTDAVLADIKAYRTWLRDLPAGLTDDDFMTFAGVPTFDEWKAAGNPTRG